MTFIILGAIGIVAILASFGMFIVEFFLPRKEEDMFSTLPWGEIIEGKV